MESVDGSDQRVIERDSVLYPHPGVCVIRGDGSKQYGAMSLSGFSEMHPGAGETRVDRARSFPGLTIDSVLLACAGFP